MVIAFTSEAKKKVKGGRELVGRRSGARRPLGFLTNCSERISMNTAQQHSPDFKPPACSLAAALLSYDCKCT